MTGYSSILSGVRISDRPIVHDDFFHDVIDENRVNLKGYYFCEINFF